MEQQKFRHGLDTSGLCSFCRQIDFHGLLGLDPHHVHYNRNDSRYNTGKKFDPLHNYRVLDLERLRRAPHLVSYCDFCRFLEALRPLNHRSPEVDALSPRATVARDRKAKAYSLYALCPCDVYRLPETVSHSRLLAVLPTNAERVPENEFSPPEKVTYIMPVTKGAYDFSGRLIRERFDITIARRWLEFCDKHHSDHCVRGPIPLIPDFRVIDCKERRIVPLESINSTEPFVALSYKWGSTASGAPTTPLPEFLPATVTDAIYVTMQLGYNYLWVDRYCISQNDQHAKHVQIQSMNLVYKHAALTIIAATGEDATAGLSGVRPRKKPMQLSIKLGHMQLVATMDQITDIATSPWNSRGWTFQEGLLSNRRLLFGPRQISFECQAMNCLESIKFPLELMPVYSDSGPRFGKFFPTVGIYNGIDAFNERLTDYLTKSLSYESDTLKAFSGILKEFEMGPDSTKLFSFVGLPIIPRQCQMTKWLVQVMYTPASLKDMWRRKSFPSWSWAGWTRSMDAKFQTRPNIRLGTNCDLCCIPLVNVTVDFGRYGTFDWEQFWWEIIQVASYESRKLRLIVEGWFLDFKVLNKNGSLICDDYSEQPLIQTFLSSILSDPATINSMFHRIQIPTPPAWESHGKHCFSWMLMLADLTATFAETLILIKCCDGSHECVVRRLEAFPAIRPVMEGLELPQPFRYGAVWLS